MKNRVLGSMGLIVSLIFFYFTLSNSAHAVSCGDESCDNGTCSGTCELLCDGDTGCPTCSNDAKPLDFLIAKVERCASKTYDALIPRAWAIAPPGAGCEWFCSPPAGACFASNLCGGYIANGADHIKAGGKCKKCNSGAWSAAQDCTICGKYNPCDYPVNKVCVATLPACAGSTSITSTSSSSSSSSSGSSSTTGTTATTLSDFSADLSSVSTFSTFSTTASSSSSSSTSGSSSASGAPAASSSSSAAPSSSSSTSAGTAPGVTPTTNSYCANNCPLYADTWQSCEQGWVLSKYRHCSGRSGTICTPTQTTKTRSRNPRCGEPVPNRVDP